MSVQLEITEQPARECSALLVGAAAGSGHIVLTGGSTPRAAYEDFARTVEEVGIDISGATFWFGDERCVQVEDERSNYGMAKAALFDRLPDLRSPQVKRMRGELGPEEGARDYERQLEESAPDQFDLLLLGLGSDGHLASLFPRQSTLKEREREVVGVPEAGLEPFVPRISLTLPRLARARQVVFLVSGESKAKAVRAAFGEDAQPREEVPASMLPPLADEVIVLLDPAAATGL